MINISLDDTAYSSLFESMVLNEMKSVYSVLTDNMVNAVHKESFIDIIEALENLAELYNMPWEDLRPEDLYFDSKFKAFTDMIRADAKALKEMMK